MMGMKEAVFGDHHSIVCMIFTGCSRAHTARRLMLHQRTLSHMSDQECHLQMCAASQAWSPQSLQPFGSGRVANQGRRGGEVNGRAGRKGEVDGRADRDGGNGLSC